MLWLGAALKASITALIPDILRSLWEAITKKSLPPVKPEGTVLPVPEVSDNPIPSPQPDAGGAIVVEPGVRVEKVVAIPCTMSFTLCGIMPFTGRGDNSGNNPDSATLAWAYSVKDGWRSGKKAPVVHLRTYKLITNDNGHPREAKLLEEEWNPARRYRVVLRITRQRTVATVRDEATGQEWGKVLPFEAPPKLVMGYGWPHAPRPGVMGATISEVNWK